MFGRDCLQINCIHVARLSISICCTDSSTQQSQACLGRNGTKSFCQKDQPPTGMMLHKPTNSNHLYEISECICGDTEPLWHTRGWHSLPQQPEIPSLPTNKRVITWLWERVEDKCLWCVHNAGPVCTRNMCIELGMVQVASWPTKFERYDLEYDVLWFPL